MTLLIKMLNPEWHGPQPRQRRVRRAPNIAYDFPGTASDNQRTTDQFDMFNGSPERYTWTLKGKQEMLVPYNSFKAHG